MFVSLVASGASATSVSAVESGISSLTDGGSLGTLSGGVGLVGGLLGGSQISKSSLLLVGEGLGVGLGLVGHLSLRGLLGLGGLEGSNGLGSVRLGRFSSRSQRLGLLQGLNFGSFSCLHGLSGLGSLS